jgi:hypothetical protein
VISVGSFIRCGGRIFEIIDLHNDLRPIRRRALGASEIRVGGEEGHQPAYSVRNSSTVSPAVSHISQESRSCRASKANCTLERSLPAARRAFHRAGGRWMTAFTAKASDLGFGRLYLHDRRKPTVGSLEP